MRGFIRGVGRFFASQWRQYNELGQLLFVLALVAIATDVAIAYQYGRSMTWLHGVGFGVVALAFCVLPDVAMTEARRGRWAAASGIGLACAVVLFPVSWQSHLGYGAGVRLGDMQQTDFQHASLEATRAALRSEEANIEMWRRQLADLKERNRRGAEAFAARNSGWVLTVEPKALNEQIAALDVKIANEARRVRCGQKCEELMQQRAALMALAADITAENDLSGRIEATQRVIDAKLAELKGMGYRSSAVVNQNDVLAKLFNLVAVGLGYGGAADEAIRPTEVQRVVANTTVAGAASLAFMLVGPLLFLAAGLNRVGGVSGGVGGGGVDVRPDPVRVTDGVGVQRSPAGVSMEPIHVHTREEVVMRDPAIRRWALSEEVMAMLGKGAVAA